MHSASPVQSISVAGLGQLVGSGVGIGVLVGVGGTGVLVGGTGVLVGGTGVVVGGTVVGVAVGSTSGSCGVGLGTLVLVTT